METLALVAHNEKKDELLAWVKDNLAKLNSFNLIGTSITAELVNNILNLEVEPFGHGTQGGDILLAARILRDKYTGLFSLWISIPPTVTNTSYKP